MLLNDFDVSNVCLNMKANFFFFFSLKASNYCPILSPMPACCLKLLPCC